MRLLQVDAFADRAFTGNPAAVCLLDRARPDAWMQALAAEMNLSETAFVRPDDGHWGLRWFTPVVEVDLCGHATLASAHALFEERLAGDTVRFQTRSGVLTARARDGWIELDFPALPVVAAPPPPGLLDAIGVEPVFTGRSRFDNLVEVRTEAELRAAAPDFRALAAVDTRGVVVTCPGTGDFDFVSRFFCPGVGVNEDPVTGSAHCVLAPYWADKLGRASLTGFQASARGGVVRVEMRGERVGLLGKAVTVFRGDLNAETLRTP